MTRARRRVVRLALMLKVACIEPVFSGCNSYGEIQAGLELQFAGLTLSRRKAVRRQTLRLVSEAGGLAIAADHLVARNLPKGSTRREVPIESSLDQMLRRQPESPRCSVCRMRFGLPKRSFPSIKAALEVWEKQNDPQLVVYACPAGAGYHLGHPPTTRPATVGHPASTQRRESHRNHTNEAPMQPTPKHKEYPMTMRATLGHPVLVLIYSAALLLIGCGVGRHWIHTSAFWLSIAGGVLMVAHDFFTGFLMFFLSARWVRSAMSQRK